MKSLSLGYSPCPNDTFIFYAAVHGKVDTGGLDFSEVLLDVETLNQRAIRSEPDITKVSYHAFGHMRDKYCLLRSGSALGRGCGPLVIARDTIPLKELTHKKIAVPGELTTANLLLKLFYSSLSLRPSSLIVMPFHEIIDAVSTGKVNAGVIIHESRFTYQHYGLIPLVDLGDWWEKETGLPIPLGGIIARRSLGDSLIRKIDSTLRLSVEYAFTNRKEPMNYIQKHSQELSEDVINQHINLYVNNFSIDLGKVGEKSIHALLSRAEKAGIIPVYTGPLFYD